jgi:hypothetical protein
MPVSSLPPESDILFTLAALGQRWKCHPRSAQKRAIELGVPILKFNRRAFSVRLSDVLNAEEKAAKD